MAAHPGLRLVQGAFDGEALPVPAESADVVVCNQVYEHDADPARLVANIARVLRPGGRCYFAGPNLLWPVEPHVFWPFVHWLPRRAAQACMRALGSSRAGELDAWSRDWLTLRRWFREHRFERRWVLRERLAAEFDVRGRPRMAAGIARLPSWLFALLEPISPGFIYVLRKPLVPEGHG
ncbi:hypothetical protein P873_03090 [Arenimonas composti TR7-09 = DSM 18010]|uniref:Methyltransferase type 11 domain-containing protein n=2 Tax=Arenimonas TaxID=490567 RepID=A0A091C3M7_9GAMM|nr:hypothetical protein P873_03090 [Arenimonas composti TR7-09 = DSM 18010]